MMEGSTSEEKGEANIKDFEMAKNSEIGKMNPLHLDLILDTVFSRLSRADLYKCRQVSKGWKDRASFQLFKPDFDLDCHVIGTIGFFISAGAQFFDLYKPRKIAIILAYDNLDYQDKTIEDASVAPKTVKINFQDFFKILQNPALQDVLETLTIYTIGHCEELPLDDQNNSKFEPELNLQALKSISLNQYCHLRTHKLPPNFTKILRQITKFCPKLDSMHIDQNAMVVQWDFLRIFDIISKLKTLEIHFHSELGQYDGIRGQILNLAVKSGLELETLKLKIEIPLKRYVRPEDYAAYIAEVVEERKTFYLALEDFLRTQANSLENLNLEIFTRGPELDRVHQLPTFPNLKALSYQVINLCLDPYPPPLVIFTTPQRQNFGQIDLDKFPKLQTIHLNSSNFDDLPIFSGISSTVTKVTIRDFCHYMSLTVRRRDILFWFYKLKNFLPNVKELKMDWRFFKSGDNAFFDNPNPNPWENTLETFSISTYYEDLDAGNNKDIFGPFVLDGFKGLKRLEVNWPKYQMGKYIKSPRTIKINMRLLKKIQNLQLLKIGRYMKVSEENLREIKKYFPKVNIKFHD